MATYNHDAKLWIETCCTCKCQFGMGEAVYRAAQERCEQFLFYCPNGHKQHYVTGDSDETKLRRERDRLKQDQARLSDMLKAEHEARIKAERRASAYKGQATKIRTRVRRGVCPCCNRTFADLARHMGSKHPDFTPEPTDEPGHDPEMTEQA